MDFNILDPGILKELAAYLMVVGGGAGIIALAFGAGTHHSKGTTKVLGTFISVGLMSAAAMIFLISTAIACYAYGTVSFYLFLFAFSGLVSIIAGAVVIYRLFPDKKPDLAANNQEQQAKEKIENKDQVPQT